MSIIESDRNSLGINIKVKNTHLGENKRHLLDSYGVYISHEVCLYYDVSKHAKYTINGLKVLNNYCRFDITVI